jgi:hypothetical protein
MGSGRSGEQAPPIPEPSRPDDADRQITPALPTKPAGRPSDQDAAITERTPAKDQGRRRMIETVAAVMLVVGVVVAGFLLGRGGANGGAPAVARDQVVNAGGLRLDLPAGWQRQRGSPPQVPGLTLRAEIAAAPEGRNGVGMIAGRLATVWPTFLPEAFARGLPSPPNGERVRLGRVDAIRYAGLAPRGYDGIVDVYIFPQAGLSAAVACFGGQASGAAARAPCAQIAADAKLSGAHPYPLELPKGYVSTLRSAIASLNASRSRSASAISHAKTAVAQAAAADRVARAYSVALARIGGASVTPYAEPAAARVAAALRRARAAYVALTKAARPPEHPEAWRRARIAVVARETELRRALSGLSLLVLR